MKRARLAAMGACLCACGACLYENFSGNRAFGPWIVLVALTFCLYLTTRVREA